MTTLNKKLYNFLSAFLDEVYISDQSIAKRVDDFQEIVGYSEHANLGLSEEECKIAQKAAKSILVENPDFHTNSNADNFYQEIEDAIEKITN